MGLPITPRLRTVEPTLEHAQLMVKLKGVLAEHPTLDGIELLAVTAQLVGNIIACMDQNAWTPETIMEMVSQNIAVGNRVAIAGIFETRGNA
jgi:hypothetical protein